jgi:hypothetical protein
MTTSHYLLTTLALISCMFLNAQIPVHPGQTQYVLNEPVDISGDFYDFINTYYLADKLESFDPGNWFINVTKIQPDWLLTT